jgi:hypothetical protein
VLEKARQTKQLFFCKQTATHLDEEVAIFRVEFLHCESRNRPMEAGSGLTERRVAARFQGNLAFTEQYILQQADLRIRIPRMRVLLNPEGGVVERVSRRIQQANKQAGKIDRSGPPGARKLSRGR